MTSFRPKNPHLRDDSSLETVRGISDINELYYQFGEYRLEMLEERIRAQLKDIRKHKSAGKSFDTNSFKAFLDESEAFLHHTNNEIVKNDLIVKNYIFDMNLPNVRVSDPAKDIRPRI